MTTPLLVVGGSLGGTRALTELLCAIGPGNPAAIAVALHRTADADGTLVQVLERASGMRVVEAEDGLRLWPAQVVVAPADYHLLVDNGKCSLSIDPPVMRARPSIDVLFESASWWAAGPVAGVLLTGASEDGARGMAAIKECGGLAFAQDPASAEAPRMPLGAIARCFVDAIGTPEDIGRLASSALQRVPAS